MALSNTNSFGEPFVADPVVDVDSATLNVDTQHPDYAAMLEDWQKCRDVKDGERAVKARGAAYLPSLDNQDQTEYGSYKMRALFFGAMQRAVEGYAGALFNQPPTVSCSDAVRELLKDIGGEQESFEQVLTWAADELMTVGRVGILIDRPSQANGPLYLAPYVAESIINWRTGPDKKGRTVLTMVVLAEQAYVQTTPYAHKFVQRYRVLELDGDGFYLQRLHEKRITKVGEKETIDFPLVADSDVSPSKVGGGRLDYIPFTIFNATTITSRVGKPPLLDLADCNLSHYRSSADLEHGRHYTALPTPIVIGYKESADPTKRKRLKLGSTEAWTVPDPAASVSFLEFSGQGLGSLERALDQKERQMAIIAARFLEPPKKAAEAAQTVSYNRSGDTASLIGVARQLAAGGTQLLVMISDWSGDGDKGVALAMGQDFDNFTLHAQEIMALSTLVDAGKMAYDDFFATLQRAKFVASGVTAAEYRTQIANNPAPPPLMTTTNRTDTPKPGKKSAATGAGGKGGAVDGDKDGIVNEGKNGAK